MSRWSNLPGKITWFPGHMATTARELRTTLDFVGTVIEVRDARIPFTSGNPLLEEMIQKKNRIILLNKTDLVDKPTLKEFRTHFLKNDYQVITTTKNDKSRIVAIVPSIAERLQKTKQIKDHNAVVLGIPNVGKSTLINILKIEFRKGSKVAKTGPLPGVTRSVSCFKVNEEPALYILDTPGVMIPSVSNIEMGLKLAITGAIKDSIVGEPLMADYLLEQLNKRNLHEYVKAFDLPGPVEDGDELLSHIATKYGKKDNFTVAARYFLSKYRAGQLGLFVLDTPPSQPPLRSSSSPSAPKKT